MQGHSFPYHWIAKAVIVISLVQQKILTNLHMLALSEPEFCSCSVINQLVIVRQFHENCCRLAFIVTIGQMIVSFQLIDYYYQFIFCYILGWTFHFVLWISQYSSMHYLQNPLIQYALGVLYIKQYKLLTLGTESWLPNHGSVNWISIF